MIMPEIGDAVRFKGSGLRMTLVKDSMSIRAFRNRQILGRSNRKRNGISEDIFNVKLI